MNETDIKQLAQKVFALLDKYGVDAEEFDLHILVPNEYYETVKHSFTDRNPYDVVFRVRQENWLIGVSRRPEGW